MLKHSVMEFAFVKPRAARHRVKNVPAGDWEMRFIIRRKSRRHDNRSPKGEYWANATSRTGLHPGQIGLPGSWKHILARRRGRSAFDGQEQPLFCLPAQDTTLIYWVRRMRGCWVSLTRIGRSGWARPVQRAFLSHGLGQSVFHEVGQAAAIGGRTILALQTAAAVALGAESSEVSRNAHPTSRILLFAQQQLHLAWRRSLWYPLWFSPPSQFGTVSHKEDHRVNDSGGTVLL
jgi:hypothetical protein